MEVSVILNHVSNWSEFSWYIHSNLELKLVLIVILKNKRNNNKNNSKGDHPVWNNKVTPIGHGSLNENHRARHGTSRSYWSGKLNKTLNQHKMLPLVTPITGYIIFSDYVCKFLILSENS